MREREKVNLSKILRGSVRSNDTKVRRGHAREGENRQERRKRGEGTRGNERGVGRVGRRGMRGERGERVGEEMKKRGRKDSETQVRTKRGREEMKTG